MIKKSLLLSMAVAFCLCASVQAESEWNGSADKDWNNSSNWSPSVTPDASTNLSVTQDSLDDVAPLIETGDVALGREIFVGKNTGRFGRIDVSGGRLESNWKIWIGHYGSGVVDCNDFSVMKTTTSGYDISVASKANSESTLNVSDNATVVAQRWFWVGLDGTGTMNLSDDATVRVKGTNGLRFGQGSGQGTLNMDGGTINVDYDMWIGGSVAGGTGAVNMTAGTINVGSALRIAGHADSYGTLNLDGGVVNASGLLKGDNGRINIAGGTLVLDGNVSEDIVTDPNIIAFDNFGRLIADYDSDLDTTSVTALGPDTVIDLFENYNDTAELMGAWTATDISLETTNVFAGVNAMAIDYSGSSSEASRALSLDISAINAFDAKAMTLYVAGSAGNADLPLSVRLESPTGNDTVFYDGLTSLDEENWIQWDIDLADFTGVDLNNVTKFAIVVGDGTTSGTGTLYIDHILLNPRRCVPDYAMGDVNGDCISNLIDFEVLAQDWLDSSYEVTPVDPGTTDLVLHYTLDDSAVADETGSYDGTQTNGIFTAAGGYDSGGYLTLDGSGYIEVPPTSLSTVETTGEVSVSVWIRSDSSLPIDTRQMLFSAQTADSDGHILTANIPYNEEIAFESGHITPQEPDWDSYYWGWDTTGWEAPESAYRGSTWNHFVFTKDIAEGVQKIYHNGQLVAITKGATAPIEQIGMFTIGSFRPGHSIAYYGDVDDFRIYDTALTPDEVLYLAGGSAFIQPLVSTDADFDESGDIYFGDLEIMSSYWLEDQLWPAP